MPSRACHSSTRPLAPDRGRAADVQPPVPSGDSTSRYGSTIPVCGGPVCGSSARLVEPVGATRGGAGLRRARAGRRGDEDGLESVPGEQPLDGEGDVCARRDPEREAGGHGCAGGNGRGLGRLPSPGLVFQIGALGERLRGELSDQVRLGGGIDPHQRRAGGPRAAGEIHAFDREDQ